MDVVRKEGTVEMRGVKERRRGRRERLRGDEEEDGARWKLRGDEAREPARRLVRVEIEWMLSCKELRHPSHRT